jgi:hypothetical protein
MACVNMTILSRPLLHGRKKNVAKACGAALDICCSCQSQGPMQCFLIGDPCVYLLQDQTSPTTGSLAVLLGRGLQHAKNKIMSCHPQSARNGFVWSECKLWWV